MCCRAEEAREVELTLPKHSKELEKIFSSKHEDIFDNLCFADGKRLLCSSLWTDGGKAIQALLTWHRTHPAISIWAPLLGPTSLSEAGCLLCSDSKAPSFIASEQTFDTAVREGGVDPSYMPAPQHW